MGDCALLVDSVLAPIAGVASLDARSSDNIGPSSAKVDCADSIGNCDAVVSAGASLPPKKFSGGSISVGRASL